MARILALDTAGSACSVAIGDGDRPVVTHRQEMRHGHAEALMPMVDDAMREAGLTAHELDAVAVSLGPGGFTGIRVGLAAAHGIALAANARLVGVSSFAAVAALLEGQVLVALDSRRADLYVQLCSPDGEPDAVIPDRLGNWLAGRGISGPIEIAGDATGAAAAALAGRARPLPGTAPDARGVLTAARRIVAGDAAPTLPRALYLRPPDVTFAASGAASAAAPRPSRPPRRRRITTLPMTAAVPLAMLHRACFPDDPWEGDAMARILGLSGCFGRLAWEGGDPCGFVLARDLGDECEILSVGVEPAARGHGLGTRLMGAALAEARWRDIPSVVLEVAADNEAAQRLYRRLGFVGVGRRPRYYRRPDGLADALILRLSLRDPTIP
ncbi:MAG TPA: tRNA (adenosine(37)-N6)-threonylcarbamoyltransferase complex dimerization subunit type 1 TsaB [Stellaceae bacterium]